MKNLISMCSICYDVKNKETGHYYTPTTEERRAEYFAGKRISHGYCPKCFILMAEKDGYTPNELEDMIKSKEQKA